MKLNLLGISTLCVGLMSIVFGASAQEDQLAREHARAAAIAALKSA